MVTIKDLIREIEKFINLHFKSLKSVGVFQEHLTSSSYSYKIGIIINDKHKFTFNVNEHLLNNHTQIHNLLYDIKDSISYRIDKNYKAKCRNRKIKYMMKKIQIKELKQLKNYKTSFGLTTVTIKDNILSICHNGNMGNSIEQSVNPNLKKLEFPTVSELKSELKILSENGNPDYMWEIKFYLN